LPPANYLKRSAGLLLLRPSTFLANARDVADLAGHLAPQVARYPGVIAPTLVMSGNMDFIVAAQRHAVAFANAVPHAKLVLLPGMGHMFHHAAADWVVAEIEGLAATAASPMT
jgi:pimeloyl-ACP methyl ester carboxylesterase